MMKLNYKRLTGKVITKDDFEYEEERKAWNRAIEKYPLAIVFCYEKNDIINAINWAIENNIDIRIRSGRHNYEGYSTGDDVLVIDISRMNNINLNEEEQTVTIEGGVRNRELYEVLGDKNYPFPGGGCPTVGVAGFTLGGGWGYSSRMFGLGCDSLMEIEMVNYKGETIIANHQENKDLLWACSGGGGGNLGVITKLKFKIPNKIKMATLINIDYPNINEKEKAYILKIWQENFGAMDNRINMKMAIYNSLHKGTGIKITGLFYGSKEEALKEIKCFKECGINGDYNLEYITVLEANRKIQNSHPDYEKYKSSGRFVYRKFNDEEIEKLIHIISDKPKGAEYIAISFYGLGGKIKTVGNDETAYCHREAEAILGIQSVWQEDKYAPINRKWVVDKYKYIKTITKGAFINFPIEELNQFEDEYYREAIKRLRTIKQKYDPNNIFSFPQSINGEK